MKIVKYKKISGSKYQIILENDEKINLYENTILEKELLLKKEITDFEEIIQSDKKHNLYHEAIKYLNFKLRSIKEMREYLRKKEYSDEEIEKTITRLKKEGYLNDEFYAKSYINDRLNLSVDGPNKIKKYLESNDIDYDIYSKYLDDIESEVWKEKITNYLTKQSKSNKKSFYMFKNKMLLNLVNLGYSRETVLDALDSLPNFDQSSLKETEREKILKKLSRKYSGKELEEKVREKLYQKGFFD